MTRELTAEKVLCAILEGKDSEITRAEWRTTVGFLHNRQRDQAISIKGLQDQLEVHQQATKRAVRQEGLF